MAKSRENLEAELKGWQRVYKAAEKRKDKAGMEEAHRKANEVRRQMGTLRTESRAERELNGWGYTYNAAKRRGDAAGMAEAHTKANEIRAEQGWEYDPETGKTKDAAFGPFKRTVNSKTVMENAKIRDPKQVKPYTPKPITERYVSSPAASYLTGPRAATPSSSVAASMQQKTGDDRLKELARRAVPGNEDKWSPEGVARGFGYGVERTLSGAAGALEDAARFVSGYGNKLLSGITSLGGLADNPVSDYLARTAENTLSNSFTDQWRSNIENRYQPDELSQKIGNLGEAAGAMLPTIAAGFASGGLSAGTAIGKGAAMTAQAAKAAEQLQRGIGLAAMLPSVMGSSTRQAMQEGADINEALAYGALSGALETGTESMFAGLPGIKSGVVSDILRKATQNPIVNRVADTLGEGVEEVVSGALSPYLQRMTYNEQAELASNEDLMNQFVSGVLISGLMQGATGIAGRIAQPRESSSLDTSGLGENSQRSYEYLKGRNQSTPDFDAQWSRYNQMGNAGIPLDQVEDYPSRTPIDKATAYAAHASGMNDYRARAVQDARDILDGKTMQDSAIDRALDIPQSRKMLEAAIGKTLPDSYAKAQKVVWDWQAGQTKKSAPSGTQYKIEKASDGTSFVDVEGTDLSGMPYQDIPKALTEIVRTKFSTWVEANGQKIGVNSKTAKEWARSKDAQRLYNRDKQGYADKTEAFGYADELLQVSRDYVGEQLKHVRKDSFTEFARGKVDFRVDGRGYEADIVVGITSKQTPILYDIVNIRDKNITEAPNTTLAAQNADDRRLGAPVEASIAQQNGRVKSPGLVQNDFSSRVDRGTSDAIDRIAKKAGITVEIADDVPAAGEYKDGVIRINANAENPVRQVFVHELTHHLERSGDYQAFADLLRKHYEADGVDFSTYLRDIQNQYAANGIELDESGVMKEAVAEISETVLFTDERSVQRLAQENRSLVQKIRDWLHEMRVKLRGTQEEKFVLEAEKMYQKVLDSARGQKNNAPGGTQYKIETLPSGKQYVKADRPVIQGDDPKQWSRQAERFINEKIRDGEDITVFTPDGFAVQITDRSAYKLTDTHVQRIQKIGRDKLPAEALSTKMRAAGHIDELIETARWKNWQADKNGNHANDIGEQGFDYFTTYFEDENGDYYRVVFSAGVNEGTGNYINDDTDTVYSIGDMQKRNRSANNGSSASPTGSGALTARTVPNASIPSSSQKDNPGGQNISEKPVKFKGLALQREYRQAVERGDMEHARDMLKAKAEQRGYKAYDTASERQNHVIQTANPVQDDYHTWIRDAGEIRTFEQTLQDPEWNGMDFDPDYTWEMAQDALRDGKIKVYSSYPIGTLGGFVSPSRMEAETYAGDGTVYEGTVKLDDVAWIDPTQGQYAPTTEADVYKEDSPYPKALDVTYDESGKLIPFSQRYDSSNPDRRYKVGSGNFFDRLERTGQKEVADKLRRASKQYGTYKRGEYAARDVQIPKQMNNETRVSRFSRTAAEASALTDEQAGAIGKAVAEGKFNYDPIPDKAAKSHARAVLAQGDGYAQDVWNRVVNNNRVASKNDIAVGEYLLQKAAKEGDVDRVVELTAQIAAEGTRAGQIVQAMRLIKQLDGPGQAIALDATIKKLQGELDRGKSGVVLKVPKNLRENLVKAKGKEQVNQALDEIYENLAEQIPTRWEDKWNAWRYFSMLGNPRTHIRNVLGNVAFSPVVGVKNAFGALMESGVYHVQKLAGKEGIERTKTIRGTIPKTGGALRQFAMDDFSEVEDIIKSGGKMNPSDIIRDKQQVFRFKPLEWLRKQNFNLLEKEDETFLKHHYVRSMTQYMQANRVDMDHFDPENRKKDAVTLQKARDYAIREAQKATFRDFSRAAQAISQFSRNAGTVPNILIEGVLPFKKTPINVLKRGVEYSPAGLLDAVTRGAVKLKKGEISANEFIDRLAAGMTGTGIAVVGYLLAGLGNVVGGAGDDEEAKFRDSLGLQSYALKFGDKTYTIDWLAPAALPFFVGAEFNSLQNEVQEINGRVVWDSMLNIIEPMTKMSMLDGLNGAIRAIRYEDDPATGMIVNAITGYLGQAVPTILGQVARTIDDTARTTYADKNVNAPDFLQKAMQKNRNKIPVLSKNSIAYRDVFGRPEKDESLASRAVQNFISPGYFSEEKVGAMESELIRVYRQTGQAIPNMPEKSFNIGETRKDLTAEEYEKFSYNRGAVMYNSLSEMTANGQYTALDDTDKASAIGDVISAANAFAKTEVSDYHLDGWIAKARDASNVGISLANYVIMRTQIAPVESLKYSKGDKQGDTIRNSKGLQVMQAINQYPGLSEQQRKYLYTDFGVGKKIIGYNPARVEQELNKMKNQ